MTSASRALLVLAAALALAAPAAGEVAVPRLTARVTDQTGTISAAERDALEAKLAAFESKKGSQVAVLIVPTTQPETIEQFSIRVADAWKLGRKGVDDGVLLLVAKNDRKMRIEVGRGLEGAIPDAVAKRIIAEYIAPGFRAGNFRGGIEAGIDRVLAVIQGEPLPAPAETWEGGNDEPDWFVILFTTFAAIAVLHGILRVFLGRIGAAAVVGGAVGAVVWVIVSMLLAAALAGAIAFVLALMVGDGKRRRGGGWSSGSDWSSGGSWSSGGDSGGGFSGGGGGFSGGGASGSW